LRAWTLTRTACARSAAGVTAVLDDFSAIRGLTHIDTVGSWGRELFRRSPSSTGFLEQADFHAVASQGRGLATRCDRRSRLPDAQDTTLRSPVLTPKALVEQLDIPPQPTIALLGDLRTVGLLREVTGWRSFRAFSA
jgi:hypothetical protein